MTRRGNNPALSEGLLPKNLQEFQDACVGSFAIPILLVTTSGRPLTVCENIALFCRRFTRQIPISRPCLDCGRQGSTERTSPLIDSPRFDSVLHECPLGFCDIAAPIVVGGETVGYMLSAQVIIEDDEGTEVRLGCTDESWGADEQDTLRRCMPRMTREKLEQVSSGISAISSLLGAYAGARSRNIHLAEQFRSQSQRLQQSLVYDAVTGVANRRRFMEALESELRRVRRYRRSMSLAAFNIKGLSKVNEEFGRDIGDAILSTVALSLTSILKETDFVGRVASSDFAVLMPETAQGRAMVEVSRVQSAIDEINASGDLPVEICLSVGVTDTVANAERMMDEARTRCDRDQEFDACGRDVSGSKIHAAGRDAR